MRLTSYSRFTREIIEFPTFGIEHLENSLRHLAVLATA